MINQKSVYRKVKCAVAGCLICLTLVGFAPTLAQANTVCHWQNPDAVVHVQNESYLPVRDVLSTFGISLEWTNQEARTKIILSDLVGKYQGIIDEKNHTINLGSQSFPYINQSGKLCLPVSFFRTIFKDAQTDWQENLAKFDVTVKVPNQGLLLQNVAAYVHEPKPVQETLQYYESGQATWYGAALQGNFTASGERFNMYDLTAAHKTLPFGTRVKVTNLNNGKSVVVRITDRGPFAPGRVIDLSMAAAQQLDMISSGVVPIKLEIVK